MPPISFKSDESFLQKLAVGATATTATINFLAQFSANPIELERGATGYKIWKRIKIKRIRVPDILCLRTAQRFEVRGKTNLEISMSHSRSDPRRAWDAGLRSDDYVAIVLCRQIGTSPVDWAVVSPIHFVLVQAMRDAYAQQVVRITEPKGVQEGSEIRIIWPSVTANDESTVTEVSEKRIVLTSMAEHKKQTCVLKRRGFSLSPQCRQGDVVRANQIVASVVPIVFEPVSLVTVNEAEYVRGLESASQSERYAAAKALRFLGFQAEIALKLRERMGDRDEDTYVRLESAAALAAHGHAIAWEFLGQSLSSPFLQVQLETVIVLSEIRLFESERLLIRTLADTVRDVEVRAGAAWALGEFRTLDSLSQLVKSFDLESIDIKTEAARALLKIAPSLVLSLVDIFKKTDASKRDGIAWALAKSGGFDLLSLLTDNPDLNLRQWTSYIGGYGKAHFDEPQFEKLALLDPEVHFAATVLWQILASWIYGLGEF